MSKQENKYAKEEIRKKYEETKSLDEVLRSVAYRDSPPHIVAFLDLVEEVTGQEIKTPAQLKKVTGSDWTVKNYDLAEVGESWHGIEFYFYVAQEERYMTALIDILKAGGTYEDLLKTNLKDYHLPESWTSGAHWRGNKRTKDKVIAMAIWNYFNLVEGIGVRAELREIADTIKAPYSVLLEASNIFILG